MREEETDYSKGQQEMMQNAIIYIKNKTISIKIAAATIQVDRQALLSRLLDVLAEEAAIGEYAYFYILLLKIIT